MSDRGRSPAPTGSEHPRGSSGSRPPSGGGSRGASPAPQASGAAAGWKVGPGHDPARSSGSQGQERKFNTRMELPPEAYLTSQGKDVFCVRGQKLNTEGAPDMVHTNSIRVTKVNLTKKIYQFDVIISPDDRRLPFKKILGSSEVKSMIAPYEGRLWLFDGKKLAWAPASPPRGELRCQVDLDKDERPPGQPVRPGAVFHVTIRQTKEISLSALQGYLDRKIEFSTPVIEALNFVDHVIRQGASERCLGIKRNFYDLSEKGRPLQGDRVVEVHKGLYASIRLSHNLQSGGAGLALNVDVTNTAFWIGGQTMDVVATNFLATMDGRFARLQPSDLSRALMNVRRNDGGSIFDSSDAFKHLRKLRKLRFKILHKGRRDPDKSYTLLDFTFDPRSPETSNARTNFFEYNGKNTSVYEYYGQKYNVFLKTPALPLIKTGKNANALIPMELCTLEPMQRYNFKLNGKQTDAMIKIAVNRPAQRRSEIESKVQLLNLGADAYLKGYGFQFEGGFTQTKARLLNPPNVDFKKGQQKPGFSGRWRLDQGDIKFWKPNVCPLKNWGILVMDGSVRSKGELQAFADKFKAIFIRHGGICPEKAVLCNPPGNINRNGAEAVAYAIDQIKQERGGAYCQLLFIVVGAKNSHHYERVKKNADCRFGILSQVVQSSHVCNDGGNSQYISNVCMKVNAKLGGSTARTASPFNKSGTYFPVTRKTMMIGVDVSHAAPGGNSASVAAMTMNCDADANRFAAVCETNGYREETVLPGNMQKFFGQLGAIWRKNHGNQLPDHIMYLRDGVAENHFSLVLDREIEEIRRFFREKNIPVPKITVIIATKRHHHRFFPGNKSADKNGNSKPGLIVEHEVTHPFLWDFFLNSHSAIQGTARPVHYYVILDEMNCPVNDLQKMIYHQCYSYVRSTTPVSIHPAIYYAHLAADRARFHENVPTSEGFRHGGKGHEMLRDKVAKGQSIGPGASLKGQQSPPLIELGGKVPKDGKGMALDELKMRQFIRETMWFI